MSGACDSPRRRAGGYALPVLQSCGHTAEAVRARRRVLSGAPGTFPTCETCHADIAPWMPVNVALAAPEQVVPLRLRDVVTNIPASPPVLRPADARAQGSWRTSPEAAARHDLLVTRTLRAAPSANDLVQTLALRVKVRISARHGGAAAADLALLCELDGGAQGRSAGQRADLLALGISDPASAGLPSDLSRWPAATATAGGDHDDLHELHTDLHDIVAPQVMFEPVALSCGHSFDRTNLLRLAERERCRCPLCRSAVFPWHVPNLAVRSHTDAFYLAHPEALPFPLPMDGVRVEGAMPLGLLDCTDVRAAAAAAVDGVLQGVSPHLACITGEQSGPVPDLAASIRQLSSALALDARQVAARALRAALRAAMGDSDGLLEDLEDAAPHLTEAQGRLALRAVARGCGVRAAVAALGRLGGEGERCGRELGLQTAAAVLLGPVTAPLVAAVSTWAGRHGDEDGGWTSSQQALRETIFERVLGLLVANTVEMDEVVLSAHVGSLILERAARVPGLAAAAAQLLWRPGAHVQGPETSEYLLRKAVVLAVASQIAGAGGADWGDRLARFTVAVAAWVAAQNCPRPPPGHLVRPLAAAQHQLDVALRELRRQTPRPGARRDLDELAGRLDPIAAGRYRVGTRGLRIGGGATGLLNRSPFRDSNTWPAWPPHQSVPAARRDANPFLKDCR